MTETVKLEIFIPELQADFLRDELAKIGVGKIGSLFSQNLETKILTFKTSWFWMF